MLCSKFWWKADSSEHIQRSQCTYQIAEASDWSSSSHVFCLTRGTPAEHDQPTDVHRHFEHSPLSRHWDLNVWIIFVFCTYIHTYIHTYIYILLVRYAAQNHKFSPLNLGCDLQGSRLMALQPFLNSAVKCKQSDFSFNYTLLCIIFSIKELLNRSEIVPIFLPVSPRCEEDWNFGCSPLHAALLKLGQDEVKGVRRRWLMPRCLCLHWQDPRGRCCNAHKAASQ